MVTPGRPMHRCLVRHFDTDSDFTCNRLRKRGVGGGVFQARLFKGEFKSLYGSRPHRREERSVDALDEDAAILSPSTSFAISTSLRAATPGLVKGRRSTNFMLPLDREQRTLPSQRRAIP